jgi:cytochrome c biogenesis protein CcmG/thiol:disulfide interchange protein DsbE
MNWRRAALGAFIAVPMIALLGYGLTRDPRALPNTMPGSVAPEFALPVMDAETDTVRLSDFRGKVVVLNFWASWCLECRHEHTLLSETADAYKDRVSFYGVLYQDSPRNARAWISEMGGQLYPNLLDPDSRMAIDYALTGVPETVIIGPDGKVVHKQIGVVTRELLHTKLDSLLAKFTLNH